MSNRISYNKIFTVFVCCVFASQIAKKKVNSGGIDDITLSIKLDAGGYDIFLLSKFRISLLFYWFVMKCTRFLKRVHFFIRSNGFSQKKHRLLKSKLRLVLIVGDYVGKSVGGLTLVFFAAEDIGYAFLHFSWESTSNFPYHISYFLSFFSILFAIEVFNHFCLTATTLSLWLYSTLPQILHTTFCFMFTAV